MTDQFVYDEDYFIVADDSGTNPTTFRRVPASNLPSLPALTSRFGWRQGNRVIWFGDSITAASAGTSISGQATSAIILDSKGFHNWANVMLRHSLQFVGNAGVSGNTTAAMLARVSEVTAVTSDWVVVLGGTNDPEGAATTTNLAAIYTALLAAGRRVVACTIPPSAAATSGQEALRTNTNDWMRKYCRSTPGMYLADTAAAVADPAGSGFKSLTSCFQADGVHPNSLGASRMGRVLADTLRPHIAVTNDQLTHIGDSSNFLSEAIITGSGTSRPTGWTGGGTATFSYQARTDGVNGSWFKAVVTAGNSHFFQINTSLTGALAVGAQCQGMIEFEVDATTSATTPPILTLQCYNGSTFTSKAYDLYHDAGATYGAAPYPIASGILQTPPLTIPSGTTLVQLVVSQGEGTFRFGRASLRVV